MLTLLLATALANPISHSGRLVDATGAPVSGEHELSFSLYAGSEGGEALWTETDTVTCSGGFYNTQLGDGTSFPAGLWDGSVRYLQIGVDGEAMAGRSPMHAVPHALSAASLSGPLDGITLQAVSGTCPGDVAAGTVEYRSGQLRACTDAGWLTLATTQDVATAAAQTWPSGSYCILAGSNDCPAGFTLYSNYIRAIESYSGNSTYFRSNPFGGSGIYPHSSHPYHSDVRMQMCCK